jgi:DNA (cytosine-5)-methyltransferase 1
LRSERMLYALDLFSGIAGNSLGLAGYVRTVAYCEADRHAQAVVLSRMADGSLPAAPICTDVTRLDGYAFRGKVDIIIAGFPCQDISCAGKGAGLEGERSGLFYEVVRLAKEIKPTFLFLENVPAIRTRGLDRVIEELTEAGYDCRWCMLSAAEIGAPHKRERWFCLARRLLPDTDQQYDQPLLGSLGNTPSERQQQVGRDGLNSVGSEVAYAMRDGQLTTQVGQGFGKSDGRYQTWEDGSTKSEGRPKIGRSGDTPHTRDELNRWAIEPDVGRVVNELPLRVDRIKRLGNAVVPAQARKAFEILIGLEE